MDDIRGRLVYKGNEVAFTYWVWDGVTELKVGEVVEVHVDKIKVCFDEVHYHFNKETSEHDIPEIINREKYLTEFIKL